MELVSRARRLLAAATVEPLLFCFVLPAVLAQLATQHLNLDKCCRALGTPCHPQEVQRAAATLAAWKNAVQSVGPAALLPFLGAWSDRRRRRKPALLAPVAAEAVACLGLLGCALLPLPPAWNVVMEAVPPALVGGWAALFMAAFSYAAEAGSAADRTLRIGAVNVAANVSFVVGNALSGVLLRYVGTSGVYVVAVGFYTVGFCYGMFVLDEVPRDGVEPAQKGFFRDFFDVRHVGDTFRVAFKKGKRNRRARICMVMVLCSVIVGPMHGEMTVLYLFLRYKFGWNEIDYSIYSTFYVVTHLFGTLFSLLLFTKTLKIDDATLGILASTARVIASLVYAFAPNSYVFYIGALIEIMNGTAFIAMRSILSKLVPPDELGKINSLFSLSEALVPIMYGPLYSIIYKHTINLFPGTFFIIGAVLTVPSMFIFCWLHAEHRRDLEEAERHAVTYTNCSTKL